METSTAMEPEPEISRSSTLSGDGVTPVCGSSLYASRAYWEQRFASESHKEWLVSSAELVPRLLPQLRGCSRVLLVGNGSSDLGAELLAAGVSRVVATDFSETVVTAMAEKHAHLAPALTYSVADMLSLPSHFADASFDAVIDKAGFDAVVADGGADRWVPTADARAAARRLCLGSARVLKSTGGVFVSVSFSQPHFRLRLLLDASNIGEPGDREREVGPAAAAADASAVALPLAPAPPQAARGGTEVAGAGGGGRGGAAEEDDEFEADLTPGIDTRAVVSQLPDLDKTPWETSSVINLDVGLGYFVYCLRRR